MTGPYGQPNLITVAACNLNQWALDFDGNAERILESCRQARDAGATYRLGPELEISGYGCEDHFLEQDTISHCWESLALLLERGATDDGLLCDFGMPVLYCGIRYNCRVLAQNRIILLVRPKMAMADNGNYRESRYFTAYPRNATRVESIILPPIFQDKFGQRTAPFGTQFLLFGDAAAVGCELCEELWTPRAPHIDLALQGVEIIGNGSGSYHELRKLHQRLELVVAATRKCGGIYLYSNQRGCDGGRTYYDGGALIVCNGQVLAQADQFCLDNVQVITATVDLDDVRSYRASIPSLGMQATATASFYTSDQPLQHNFIDCADRRIVASQAALLRPTVPLPALRLHSPQEECCLGPACWLWDYLRRSGAAGFFLPLSGGADSSSVATIVGAMCTMAVKAAHKNPTGSVANDIRRICDKVSSDGERPAAQATTALTNQEDLWIPSTPQELANYVLHTTYMGTKNSSEKTNSRAKRLGETIGSYHLSIQIDLMVDAVIRVFAMFTGKTPHFAVHGGDMTQDVALQNIQARIRMVTAYLFAQLLPWVRGRRSSGFLLVLGSANVDEGLRGYMTKYDCSSADLNPIGAISKSDLKAMLVWAAETYQWPVLAEIVSAPPTAELRPMVVASQDSNENGGLKRDVDPATNEDNDQEHSQLDEEEMGMTYEELGLFGRLRKISRCGPVTMFRKLCVTWSHLAPRDVATKVKRFFYYYAINRHKMCTLTPAYHAEAYSPDDNRFDLRPFLYPIQWPRQFAVMDHLVQEYESQDSAAATRTDV